MIHSDSTSTTLTPIEKNLHNIPTNTATMPSSGDTIGECKVLDTIAAGGMAIVYKVWHEKLEVTRAIKMLKPGLDSESRKRIETEGKIAANLRHPNIIEIFSIGNWRTIPYLEMEYVEGYSLKELIELHKRIPCELALSITHFVCQAISFAYSQDMTLYGKVYGNVIHRDLKPGNILISKKGDVKVADFGIARPSDVSLHTVGSKVMGTFAYLSPEQLNGEILDQRSDVYALGTVLYEMITGMKAFPQKLVADLVQKKSKGIYTPIQTVTGDISKSISLIVDKSLSLDKNKRYTDMQSFDHDIMAVLKKITNKTPDEICREMIAQSNQQIKIPVTKQPSFKIDSFMVLIIGSILLAGVLVSSIFFLNPLLEHYFKETSISDTEKKDVLPSNTNDENVFTPLPNTAPVKEDLPKANSSTPKAKTLLAKAHIALKRKNYTDAKNLFLNAKKISKNENELLESNLGIAESHIHLGEFGDAQNLLNSITTRDGYLYYLMALIDFHTGSGQSALNNIEKATTHNSLKNKELPYSCSFLSAQIRQELFEKQPNLKNKEASIAAWNKFLTDFCSDSSNENECLQAKEKLSLLL